MEALGIKRQGLGRALIVESAHCFLFYLGPIYNVLYELYSDTSKPGIRLGALDAAVFLKNHLFAPIFEEVIFRGCIIRLLYNAGLPIGWIVAVSAGLFGIGILLSQGACGSIEYCYFTQSNV